MKYLKHSSKILLMTGILFGQLYFRADPFYLLEYEKNLSYDAAEYRTTMFRPAYNPNFPINNLLINARSEFYYNTNNPNLENTSDKWVGKGTGFYSSLSFGYRSQYFGISVEPFYFINQNKDYDEPNRRDRFSVLNDARPHEESPYISYGIRESQIYLSYKKFGVGWSNTNMWWGSGMHTSSSMTNNTSGFGHVFLGTIEEKKFNNWSFNGRYILSKHGSKSLYNPYFVALLLGVTFYSDPIISIGFVREALLGGDHPDAQDDNIDIFDAALAIFKGILIPEDVEQYREDWSYDDHAGTIYTSAFFSKSKLILFFDIGRTDLASNTWSILVYPDHAISINLGVRKYGMFNNDNLFFAIEYFQNKNARSSHRIHAGDWYERFQYEYNTYNGRRWAAHSGSDSDDFLISFGWIADKITILPSFNYERHGLTQATSDADIKHREFYYLLPEVKFEFRLDLRYSYRKFKFNLYYEYETIQNLESRNKNRTGHVWSIGVEKNISEYFSQSTLKLLF